MQEAQLGPRLQELVGIEAGLRAQGRARPHTCLHLHQVPAEVRLRSVSGGVIGRNAVCVR